MAFASLAFVYITIILIVIATSTLIGAIFLIVAAIMKSRQKKKAIEENVYHKKYRYRASVYVLRGIGTIFMLPLMGIIVLILYGIVSANIDKHTRLGYNVIHGNYERAEEILKRGVTPDCTVESNQPAVEGEETLLLYLCSTGTDYYGELTDEEELEMMELLLKYGADIERRTYEHEEDYMEHHYDFTDESSYYYGSDECGYTPLLYAVRDGDYKKVKFLIEHGADANVSDYCGFNTVATVADNLTDSQGLDILKYLMENGAKVRSVTNYKQDAIFLSQRQNNYDNDEICKEIEKAYGYIRLTE